MNSKLNFQENKSEIDEYQVPLTPTNTAPSSDEEAARCDSSEGETCVDSLATTVSLTCSLETDFLEEIEKVKVKKPKYESWYSEESVAKRTEFENKQNENICENFDQFLISIGWSSKLVDLMTL